MSNEKFSEDYYEKALIELFSNLGYSSKMGSDIERDLSEQKENSIE